VLPFFTFPNVLKEVTNVRILSCHRAVFADANYALYQVFQEEYEKAGAEKHAELDSCDCATAVLSFAQTYRDDVRLYFLDDELRGMPLVDLLRQIRELSPSAFIAVQLSPGAPDPALEQFRIKHFWKSMSLDALREAIESCCRQLWPVPFVAVPKVPKVLPALPTDEPAAESIAAPAPLAAVG